MDDYSTTQLNPENAECNTNNKTGVKQEMKIKIKREVISADDNAASSSDENTVCSGLTIVKVELESKYINPNQGNGGGNVESIKQEEVEVKDESPSNETVISEDVPSSSGILLIRNVLTRSKLKAARCTTEDKAVDLKKCKTIPNQLQTLDFRKKKKTKRYKCDQCDFKTANKCYIKIHMGIHAGDKPFACSVCDFKTAHRDSIKKHMFSHTGEKPFACDFCEFRTANKDYLKTHNYYLHSTIFKVNTEDEEEMGIVDDVTVPA